MKTRKILALILALLMVVALFAGCKSKDDKTPAETGSANTGSGTQNPQTTTPGQVAGEALGTIEEGTKVYPSADAKVVLTTNGNFTGLTQFGNAFAATLRGSYLFYDTLLKYDINTNAPAAGLAESWEWVDDVTLRLKLKEGITSINGDPFTAADVVYSFNYNHTVQTLNSYYNMFDYDKIKAVDELTVEIATQQPYPYLPLDLCHAAFIMACEKSVDAAGGVEALKENPIAGTGAYKLIKWDEGVGIYAERRDDYWGQMPYYKYVDYLNITDANTRFMSVESGDVNMSANNSQASLESAKANAKLKTWMFAHSGQVTQLAINTDGCEPLRVLANRQALASAINYDAILQITSGEDGATPHGYLFNQFTEDCIYKDGLPTENYYLSKYDIETAKAKLIEAGYPDGFNLELKINNAAPVQAKCAEIIKSSCGQIGINVEIVLRELAALTSECRSGDWQARIVSGGNPNPTRALNTIDPRFDHATSNGSAGQYWFEGYTADQVAEMIDSVKFSPAGEKFDKAVAEFEAFVGEYVPSIPLVIQYIGVVTTNDIAGFEFDSMGTPHPASFYAQEYLDGPAK